MSKNKLLKALTICMVIFFQCHTQILIAQNTKLSKFSFSAEAIPYATFYGQAADGMQFSLGYKILKNKYNLVLTYGLNKFTYDMSGYLAPVTVNGQSIVEKYTSTSIFTPQSERIGGIADKSLYQSLEGSGLRHYSPKDAAYIRNYGSLEILRRYYFKQKWELEWGGGLQMGILSRDLPAGALNDTITATGEPVVTWVIYRISARYLYYGWTAKVSFTRKITDHFSLGITTGLNQSWRMDSM
jgi:hypothetical protein